jgi:sec-independent protein translocase protein TatA
VPSNLGAPEILVILIVALIVLGPKRLPEAGRQVGRALAEVRRWSHSMQEEIRDVIDTEPAASAPMPAREPLAEGPAPASDNGSSEGPPRAGDDPSRS